ncbi:beta-N-acetylhexosaminidase [Burkholderia sp. Ac-20365]|uniref:beta-N-acetylhexosaminidase n=1 Tax=Burkholderia sp. Ac-20365 TaxID=2703897 RepID=UPI00197C7D69|nr:beta-N-acetylhexosaminidase [Burkholderia sp. Ac-20365]MBN3765471.1 beta-N-acetylhexosaminidase [Burkholderia sp. Ac-20365]
MKLTPGPVMLDVVGKTLNADDERRLAHPMTGGVILFARHFENRAQLVALTDAIRAIRPDLLIAVDHEGGRVQRFRTDGFTVLPAMGKLGALWDEDVLRATKVTTAVGYVLASELRACGIDMSFTPVLDLNFGHSQVIGDRAFHRDPRVVTLLAKSLNHGLALAGMANCAKHFPGHGFATADSHVAVPVDERTLDEILSEDVAPYDWLGLSLASVLPGHVIYPKIDSKPAGFSRVWIQDILRTRLGFKGAIFSDDLSMEAARQGGTLTEASTAALEAGVDMVLICNQPEEAGKVLEALRFTQSEASKQRLEQMRPRGGALSWDDLMAEPQYQQAKTLLREAFPSQAPDSRGK